MRLNSLHPTKFLIFPAKWDESSFKRFLSETSCKLSTCYHTIIDHRVKILDRSRYLLWAKTVSNSCIFVDYVGNDMKVLILSPLFVYKTVDKVDNIFCHE